MPIVKVGAKHQVVIPNKIFSELGVCVGDFLEAEKEDNYIVLKPVKVIPKDQAWFWTKEWQEGEAEADRDIAEGRLSGTFDKAKDLIDHLRKKNENKNKQKIR